MKENLNIETDNINIYLQIRVISKKIGRITLSIIIILLIIFWIFAFSIVDGNEKGKIIAGLIIPCSLSLFLSIRYLLWNSFGFERIIINTKTISYCYNYGLFQPPLRTLYFNQLAYNYVETRKENNLQFGEIVFFQYNSITNLPEIIHETTIEIESSTYKKLENMIIELFENENAELTDFSGYSLN
jgi:hypothetical protein